MANKKDKKASKSSLPAPSVFTSTNPPTESYLPSISTSTACTSAHGLASPAKTSTGSTKSTSFSSTNQASESSTASTSAQGLASPAKASTSAQGLASPAKASTSAQGLASPAKASTSLSSPLKSTSFPSIPTNQSIIAYVHHLSQLQRNQKDTMNYSTVTLQTSDHCQQALVYSNQKRKLLEDSQQFHTPLKIQRFTFTPDSHKMIINDMTHLSMPFPHEYAFQYVPIEQHVLPIAHILEANSDEPDNVVVRCKVISVAPVKVVGKRNLKLMTAILADGSGEIQTDFWEDHIDRIQIGQSYQLAPLQIRYWNGKKRLATLSRTIIEQISDESLSNIQVQEHDEHQLFTSLSVQKIKSVESVVHHLYCSNCHRRLLQPSASIAIQCDKCQHIVRTEECQTQLCAKVLISLVDGEDLHLLVYHDTLCSIIPNLDQLSNMDVAIQLLSLQNITVTYNKEDNVIAQIV